MPRTHFIVTCGHMYAGTTYCTACSVPTRPWNAGLDWDSACVWRLGGPAGAVMQQAPDYPLACTASLHAARTAARIDSSDYPAQACATASMDAGTACSLLDPGMRDCCCAGVCRQSGSMGGADRGLRKRRASVLVCIYCSSWPGAPPPEQHTPRMRGRECGPFSR